MTATHQCLEWRAHLKRGFSDDEETRCSTQTPPSPAESVIRTPLQASPTGSRRGTGFSSDPLPDPPSQSAASSSSNPYPPFPCLRGSYVITRQVLGGGATGYVHKGFVHGSGDEVAVKRLQRDTNCPLAYLELRVRSIGGSNGQEVLHLEGYIPANSRPQPIAGNLAFDSNNPYGKFAFPAGSMDGCILLVHRGGDVTFGDKIRNARHGGASGVVLINNKDFTEQFSLGDMMYPLPAMLVARTDGLAALNLIETAKTETGVGKHDSISEPVYSSLCSAALRTDMEHEVAVCRHIGKHPNVLNILDICYEDKDTLPVVVCELCRGGTLSLPTVLDVCFDIKLLLLKQMLQAAQHLHDKGVVHRDIKPDNFMLTGPLSTILKDPGTRLVIIDFGMCALTRNIVVPCGSCPYLAPEMLQTPGHYGPPRDVWSIGVVFHEVLWGLHPFEAPTDEEVIQAIESRPIPLPPEKPVVGLELPASVYDLMSGLLERDPALRLTAQRALDHPAFEDLRMPTAV